MGPQPTDFLEVIRDVRGPGFDPPGTPDGDPYSDPYGGPVMRTYFGRRKTDIHGGWKPKRGGGPGRRTDHGTGRDDAEPPGPPISRTDALNYLPNPRGFSGGS